MALEVIFGASIPRELTTPAMEYLWVKWKTLRATNQLDLQRLTEESRNSLRSKIAYMISIGDDFTFLYVGEDVVSAHRNASSGSRVSQIANPRAPDFLQVYRKVASSMSPAFVRFTSDSLENGQLWVRIVLPIQVTENSVLLVTYTEVVSHQIEVYEQLFRTAPDAMIVACAIANDAGHTVDGWITMMNDLAREMLGFSGSISNLRLSELPQFKNIDFWGRLYAPRPGAAAQGLKTDDFDLELLRFPHAFGLRLRPRVVLDVRESVPLAPQDAAISERART